VVRNQKEIEKKQEFFFLPDALILGSWFFEYRIEFLEHPS